MAHRVPLKPPTIAGFDYVRLLGSGAMSDVYLYHQQLPRRVVAVKAITPDLSASDQGVVEALVREANAIAPLSSHPSIVTIYQAGVSRDGRGLIVMEYCPTSLGLRTRQGPCSQEETLRIGVQLSGAIETAHRAGILHLDIKPANVLTTAYGRPALTDFGTAVPAGGGLRGFSIPWAAPELFDEKPRLSPLSDVFSFAATLYTLLAGRTPFEVPRERNSASDLIERITSSRLTPMDRDDLHPGLLSALERAMSLDPSERPSHAVELGRALQRIQIELGLQVTSLDLLDSAEWDASGTAPPGSADPYETRPRRVFGGDASAPREVATDFDGETIIVRRVVPSPRDLGLTIRPLSAGDSPYEVVVDELATRRPFARQVDYTTLFAHGGGFAQRPDSHVARNDSNRKGDESV
ncbi:serine/threonine-protein kinase [Microbacterium capsulatum]|uniref:non-specific serine/threonine protein kinase n=1 Tax=Microbacterium capsulatum TaxID=3041921 RepID=A0ABU0XG35_9MICO|nr:serine/threonine-protein kinase [Microbacterium sp. ASV81]MDQ4214077.1 serine/threonine-protein kinase [Microbacterium sp. ASV81]